MVEGLVGPGRVLDPARWFVVAPNAVGGCQGSTGPASPAPDGRALYVTSRVDSRVTALDPETLAVTARWDIPGGPDCVAFDPAGRLWITLRWTARVAVLDPRTGRVVTVPVTVDVAAASTA